MMESLFETKSQTPELVFFLGLCIASQAFFLLQDYLPPFYLSFSVILFWLMVQMYNQSHSPGVSLVTYQLNIFHIQLVATSCCFCPLSSSCICGHFSISVILKSGSSFLAWIIEITSQLGSQPLVSLSSKPSCASMDRLVFRNYKSKHHLKH